MTWAVISREMGGPVHQSGSFEGAQRWVNRCYMEERAKFQHVSPKLAPVDAVILFRMFLKETEYRQGKVMAKWVAYVFNDWMERNHPATEHISTKRMYSVLQDWGADMKQNKQGSNEWYLNRRHVCDECGGRKHLAHGETVCSHCGKSEVFE